jgi:drug/metabolite transporter (DMT)-like permease
MRRAVDGGKATGTGNGLVFALCGFALLTAGDSVIKSMAGEWPGTAVAALRFTIGAVALGGILRLSEGRKGFSIARPFVQLGRGMALATATLFFFLGIFAMPLAEATTIAFVSPMVAAILSRVLLGERAPRAIWLASVLAFAGVLLVLRPNMQEIGLAGLLPLASAFFFALLMVFNRMAAGTGSLIAMQFVMSAIAAPILVLATILGHLSGIAQLQLTWPDWTVVARCAIVAVTATSAHSLIFVATSKASAGAIAPMVYVQLLVAMVIGTLFYGEYPDAAALAGAALIISGGLYLWWNSTRRTLFKSP